jgi:hypothetical protein
LRIQARDGGPSPRTDTELLVFNILRNRNAPTFQNRAYNVRILETKTTGVELVTVSATDPDEEV